MSNNNEDSDDIKIEEIPSNSTITEMSSLKEETTTEKKNLLNKKENEEQENENENLNEISDEQMKNYISNYEPPEIKDWPKRPYKTIFIIILLFSSGILFIYNAIIRFQDGESKWTIFSYVLLGILVLIPGIYYGFILINILISRPGYEYNELPDLSDT